MSGKVAREVAEVAPAYRANVGAVLFGPDGRVLVGRRADASAAWQLPQGGIDPDEDPRTAVLRELREEIGTEHAEIVAEHPAWLQYDLPAEVAGRMWGGRYRGQRQRWFALRFLGTDADIRLDGEGGAESEGHPEFDAWRWVALADIPALAVAFKRPIYEILAASFAEVGREIAGRPG